LYVHEVSFSFKPLLLGEGGWGGGVKFFSRDDYE
jgi:hypothetical protein